GESGGVDNRSKALFESVLSTGDIVAVAASGFLPLFERKPSIVACPRVIGMLVMDSLPLSMGDKGGEKGIDGVVDSRVEEILIGDDRIRKEGGLRSVPSDSNTGEASQGEFE